MDRYAVLKRYFGHNAFRPGQETMINALLSGADAFGVMPTGAGKSMCYQIPALLLPGLTLVISPLISLMKDQVSALEQAGVPAACLNSAMDFEQGREVYRRAASGELKLLYVAPERLESESFLRLMERVELSLVAVDEAHCVSQWGQDFRPSYLNIPTFIRSLPKRPPVGAFTATATAPVREDIEKLLELQNPYRVVTGFDRPNLYFEVVRPDSRKSYLRDVLALRRDRSGIVYCSTRAEVERVCEDLCSHGFSATRYHAGLDDAERRANQDSFVHDRARIMVATNAFGMGIDKSNVSFVIHYNMPKSIEAYYQEAGRAGRDGSDADCVLLYNTGDVRTAQFLIQNGSENEEMDPVQLELVRQQDMKRLDAMVGYCKTTFCLRSYILEYFGQKHPESCGNCGTCRDDFEEKDITRESQMILSCIRRVEDHLGYGVGGTTIVRVLSGSKEKKLIDLGLHSVTTYGLMKTTGRTEIRTMIDHLEYEGYIRLGENQVVEWTEKAADVLYRGKKVAMLVRKESEAEKQVASKLTGATSDLYEALRELRAELAAEHNIPAYVIFSNATLSDMAKKCPKNMTEFRKVSGVGEIKANWYGKQFIQRIKEFKAENG